MNSIQVNIEANEEQQDILISRLMDLEVEGFEQTDNSLIAYFNENTFRSYEVNELLKGHLFTISTIEEKNWNEVWEHNFHPVIIGDFCGIRAEFHQAIEGVDHEMIITPKMSFGTGHHATTYMMIEHMGRMDFKNKTVLDFGTGTGILAILAEKLGASQVYAIDVDDWSIANAQENIHKNKCSRIAAEQTSQIPSGKYNIVLANINRNVILDYLPRLEAQLTDKGYLLLSGLVFADESQIVQSCNLKLLSRSERNNWISLLFIKSM